MEIARRGVLFIVSSPSGGGKTTLIKQTIAMLAECDIAAYFSVSHTTRTPRPGEQDGRDYHFVTPAVFDRMVQQGAFLEWAEYAGYCYGTSRAEVEGRLETGQDIFLDIEVQGAGQVKTSITDAVKIFIYPPSYGVLKQRLSKRRQDEAAAIRRRLRWAIREFGVAGEFDYAIINDRLREAVGALYCICLAEHHRLGRMKPRLDSIREAFQGALEEDFDE